MKRKLISFITAALAAVMISQPFAVSAQVCTVEGSTNGNTIYIAGHPDMYPIEYYDERDKEYKGLLPELYKELSAESGIDFSYVNAGSVNEQRRLAENKQVEIVSAHNRGDVKHLTDEIRILTFSKDGGKIDLCIGFTPIAPPDLVNTVTAYFRSVSSEQLLRTAVETAATDSPDRFPYLLVIVIAVLAALCLVFVLYIVLRRKKKKEENSRLTDALTGIGNGAFFARRYGSVITPVSYALYYIAYIGIDVQRILQYAEPSVSEEIQVYAASELSSAAGETDFCARISDGRFALAFTASSQDQAEEAILRLLSGLNAFKNEDMAKYHIRFQAGVFHPDAPDIPCEKALINAGHGFDQARTTGEPYVFADDQLLKHAAYVQSLRKKLRDALEKKEFRLYVQYIFDSNDKAVCGAEALSRWDSPEKGLIGPSAYISMLEASEMIDELDYYIFEECCRTLSEWKQTKKKNLWLSCNITRITLSEKGFEQRIGAIIDKYDFDIGKLVIEITEDSLDESHQQTIDNISFCKNMGCRIALDDFGCGYSSIKDLNDYPIDILKIDRALLSATKTEKGKQLMQSIVKLSHFIGIKALCEGVETENDLAVATEVGCDYLQGFLLARTNPANEQSAERNLSFK